jgi:RND family efflux transporter MFP subunit
MVAVAGGAAVLAFGLGTLFGMRFGGRPELAGASPKPVEVPEPVTATPMVEPMNDGFVGVVFARQSLDLAPSVEARVVDVPVQLGDRLKRGAIVARLDADSIKREVAAAQASMRAAAAEVQAARVEESEAAVKARRLEQIGDAVSAEELETARYRAKMATARVVGARARFGEAVAQAEKLQQLLEQAALVAPFDGVVAARFVDPGTIVGPGRPVIKLISGDDLWVRFFVPEHEAAQITVKGCVSVAVSAMPGAARGVVAMIAPQIDTAARMLMIEARLEVPKDWQGRLPAGAGARIAPTPCGPDKP